MTPDDCQISTGASLGPRLRMGAGVRIGEGVSVDADVDLGAGCVLEAGVSVGRFALIGEGAVIEAGACIGPHVSIGREARIGPDCSLHSHAVVGAYTSLGVSCVLHAFSVVGGSAQDRRTADAEAHTLLVGARCVFREHTTVSRGTSHGGGQTRLGDDVLLMAGAHVAHDCELGDGVTLANGVSLGGHVHVGRLASFGGHSAVHQFVRVGELAFVAANAMVSRDVPPFCLAAGDRARLLGLNVTGLRRLAFDAVTRAALKRAYGERFRGSPDESAGEPPETSWAALATFHGFFMPSTRGICRPRSRSIGVDTPDDA